MSDEYLVTPHLTVELILTPKVYIALSHRDVMTPLRTNESCHRTSKVVCVGNV